MVCARRNTAFTLSAAYTEDSPIPEGFDRTIGVFEVGPPAKVPQDGSKAKIKVRRCNSEQPAVEPCLHIGRNIGGARRVMVQKLAGMVCLGLWRQWTVRLLTSSAHCCPSFGGRMADCHAMRCSC